MARPKGSKNRNPRIDKGIVRTHCLKGHELTEENTYISPTEQRRCRICMKDSRKKVSAEQNKRWDLSKSGWKIEDYNRILVEQNFKCRICSVELDITGARGPTRACADHIHDEDKTPRGILCAMCNLGIGCLKDSPEILHMAENYLREFI